MNLADLRKEIVAWEASATIAFPRIRRYTLTFIDEVLPIWPILSVQQVYAAFMSHYGRLQLGIDDITPEYRIFSYILAIGSLLCHLRNPDEERIEEAHCGHWPIFDAYTRGPLDRIVQIQLLALEYLHSRYTGLNSEPRFMGLARNMQPGNYASWFHTVVLWTCFNLVWDHPGSAPLDLNPQNLPQPQKEYFTAEFGDNAWDKFVARAYNNQQYFNIRSGALMMDDAALLEDAGLDNAWIMHKAGPLDHLQDIAINTPHEPYPSVTLKVAREYVWRCERRLREIQRLDIVNRLFMQPQ
ncbi:hypothetical protein JDV02_001899 [Purpureocillium takamizusanense]|uniref:Uncharacterized protein n=1 Tax=Purpureocillium takamizusanense TaxID=2060973 RepID=A0A9Q8V821_9HYPO|nr:uncharacterized protein JDV02_001899 [Purpureocillium takamizusanense]UNI15362.1 hypothetical protein JDV02_001899 [Purpureocillium takamizusanense]